MKKQLLFLLAFLSVPAVYSQISFQEHEVTSFSYHSQDNKMADIDNDGDIDIITFGAEGVDLYENRFPEEGLMPKQVVASIPGTNFILSVDITDFDGDGDLDILGAELFQDKLFLITNLGGGNFAPFQVLKTIDQVGYVKHIDMDNDGDKDLVYKGMGGANQSMGYYENTGQPNNYMTSHIITNAFMNVAHDIDMADINLDGYTDIFFNFSTGITWIQNMGGDSFSEITTITSNNDYFYSFQLADLDNDGDVDYVGGAELNYNIKLIYKLNDGTGNFAPEQIIREGLTEIGALKLDDLDNDNKLDLIVSIRNTNPEYYTDVIWYKNNSLSNWTTMPAVDIKVRNLYRVETFDLNNDGNKDIISTSNSHRTTTYQNNGAGTFAAPKYPAAGSLLASAAVAADMDGDGDFDVVTSSNDEGKIYWYKSDEDHIYGNQIIISHQVSAVKEVSVADIDGDGDLDIVSISGPSTSGGVDKVSWYKNIDGLGNFSAQINIPIGIYDSPDGLAVYDVDADGDKDIVTSLDNWPDDGDQIVWYANNGAGTFSGEQIIAAGVVNGVTALREADIDNDGDLDLICSSRLDDKISWFKNLNGLGSFGPQQVITANAQNVSDVITTDLDGDGDQDVVYMFNNWPTNQILWQRNEDGLGAFGAAIVINSNVDSNGASTLSAGDIDNDADIDIFVGESTKTTWLENLYGQANFEPPKIIADDISTPSSSQLLDYDEDGDLDLLIASRGSNKVIWYKNEGITKNTIKGGVRLDIEGNGCEAGDTLLPNILVSTTNGSTTQATLTFQNEFAGQYRLYTNPGEYETSVIAELPAYFMLTPLSHATTFTGVGNIDTADFCIEPIGQYNDLIVALYPLDDARPGFDASYQLVYRNIGTTTLTGQVALQYDNTKMQFLNAATTPTSQTINTLYFGFADFAPFESRTVIINFNVLAPPTTNIGDNLSFNTTIESAVADYTPDDNTLILNQTVIGSYDPNDITCLEGSQVLIADADKYLHYVIRFQNTGTASAINVKVQHQLDQKLDWTTFQLMGMSHNGRTTITDGSMVEFMFNNIHLPDSTSNEAGSHGYITFAIKPKNNTLSVGDVVNATAGIYFDFNPPVITNTAATEYVEFLGIDSFNTDTIVIYPNPATEQISISGVGEILQIEIFNILGSKVFDAKDTNKVDISSLDSGVYLISIQTESGSGFKKFIKE